MVNMGRIHLTGIWSKICTAVVISQYLRYKAIWTGNAIRNSKMLVIWKKKNLWVWMSNFWKASLRIKVTLIKHGSLSVNHTCRYTVKLTSNQFLSFLPCVFWWSHWGMAHNVFWGECMPDRFHSSKAPHDLCMTQDFDEIVNTLGGSWPLEITSYKKNQPILNG